MNPVLFAAFLVSLLSLVAAENEPAPGTSRYNVQNLNEKFKVLYGISYYPDKQSQKAGKKLEVISEVIPAGQTSYLDIPSEARLAFRQFYYKDEAGKNHEVYGNFVGVDEPSSSNCMVVCNKEHSYLKIPIVHPCGETACVADHFLL